MLVQTMVCQTENLLLIAVIFLTNTVQPHINSNVYGAGSNGVLFGVSESMSLDDIYNSQRAWSDSNYDYTSRRNWTFKYLSNLSDDVFNESTTTKPNN